MTSNKYEFTFKCNKVNTRIQVKETKQQKLSSDRSSEYPAAF